MHRVIATIVATMICACTWAQDVPNLVANAGFEELEGGLPAGWELSGSADLDDAQFYAGAMGLRMSHEQASTSTATQAVRAGSREYLLLAWVRLADVAGTGVRVRILGPGGNLVAHSDPLTGTEGWRRVRLAFNPGDTNQVTVELALIDATGAAWFDDVLVGPADELRPLLAEAGEEAERENIALGRPYTLSPPPATSTAPSLATTSNSPTASTRSATSGRRRPRSAGTCTRRRSSWTWARCAPSTGS